jgi:hypothetical protein
VTLAADTGAMRRLLLALCALTLLSGCGGGVDSSLFATAVRETEAAGGAELAFQWTYHVPGRDEPVVMTGSGVEDVKGQRARITATMPGVGAEMELIADGLVMYMHFDQLSDEIGKEWMKIDMERAYHDLGVDMDAVSQFGQGTAQYLSWLEHVSGGVSDEGREQVRGVEATHYSATVDLRKVPADDPEKLVEVLGQSEIPVDVWIDDDQRFRRMELGMTMSPEGGAEIRMDMVMEYVRFGVPVDIDTPDEDDVFDATEISTQGMEQELN